MVPCCGGKTAGVYIVISTWWLLCICLFILQIGKQLGYGPFCFGGQSLDRLYFTVSTLYMYSDLDSGRGWAWGSGDRISVFNVALVRSWSTWILVCTVKFRLNHLFIPKLQRMSNFAKFIVPVPSLTIDVDSCPLWPSLNGVTYNNRSDFLFQAKPIKNSSTVVSYLSFCVSRLWDLSKNIQWKLNMLNMESRCMTNCSILTIMLYVIAKVMKFIRL